MSTMMLLEFASIAELLLCVGFLALLLHKRQAREYPWVTVLVAIHFASLAITTPLLFFRKSIGVPLRLAYKMYFFASWGDVALEAMFSVLIIYAVYKVAMKPFEGLSRVGKVVFQWAAAACALVAAALMISPHTGAQSFPILAQRLQQGINILTLCLLVFVCFATRVLGLTYRSRMFGVTLGLGIVATAGLVEAAWFSTSAGHSVYSPLYVFNAFAYLAATLVWGVYFAMPEPKRMMVLLPTTSPFFVWNRVSEALGDAPGFVAVSGFTPDMLAPAELTALTASSKFARESLLRREEAEREQAAIEAMNSSPVFHPMAIQR
jgi:hypothetical protein